MRCLKCINAEKRTENTVFCKIKQSNFHNDFICRSWKNKDGGIEDWEKELLQTVPSINYTMWISEKKEVILKANS